MAMNKTTIDYLEEQRRNNPLYQGENRGTIYRDLKRKGHKFPEGIDYKIPISKPSSKRQDGGNLTFLTDMLDGFVTDESSDFWKESSVTNPSSISVKNVRFPPS